MQVGTLFNVQVAEAMAIRAKQTESIADAGIDAGPEAMARAAREQSRILAALSTQERSDILRRIADALEANIDDIMTANQADVAAATGRIDNNLLQRLVMKPSKVAQLAEGIRQLANMDEPIGQLLSQTELAKVCSLGPLAVTSCAPKGCGSLSGLFLFLPSLLLSLIHI